MDGASRVVWRGLHHVSRDRGKALGASGGVGGSGKGEESEAEQGMVGTKKQKQRQKKKPMNKSNSNALKTFILSFVELALRSQSSKAVSQVLARGRHIPAKRRGGFFAGI